MATNAQGASWSIAAVTCIKSACDASGTHCPSTTVAITRLPARTRLLIASEAWTARAVPAGSIR
jgi:hypothetical protein